MTRRLTAAFVLFVCGTIAHPVAAQQAPADEDAPWSAAELKRRAALIYVQHVAFSLTDARDDGRTAADQGRRVGEIVARYKQRLVWDASSNALLANALAKLMEPEYDLEFGRATFTLRSPYQRAARELIRYGSSIEDYVAWLQAMHDAIGPVQGYAMTARLEGDRLVETYRDLPNRDGLELATNLPDYAPSAEELRRYEGVYTGTRVDDTEGIQYTMRVWQEDDRLWVSTWRAGTREPYGRHLVPVAEGVFIPGWYAPEGSAEIQSGARIRFSPTNAGSAARVELEVSGEDGTVLWKLRRDVSASLTAQPDDTAQVLSAAEAFLTAFNNLEWDAFHTSFDPSATVFQPFGEPWRNDGRETIAAFFGRLFEKIRSSTEGPPYMNITPRDLRIEMLEDAGIVTFHLPGRETVGRRTLVFGRQRTTDPWRLFHLHASFLERPESREAGGPAARGDLEPGAAARYAGRYATQSGDAPRMTVVFRPAGGGLEAELGGSSRALRYLGGHTFQDVESRFLFVFNVGRDGQAMRITGLPPELDRVEVFERVEEP